MKKELIYCRRRPTGNCSIKTYNKNGICANCQDQIEMLAEDIKFAKELGLL